MLVILASMVAVAQEPQPTPPSEPPRGIYHDRIDTLLRDWSVKTRQIKALYTEFTRTTVDVIFGGEPEVAPGSARYLFPNRARLDVTGDKPESYVLTGKGEIWVYKPRERKQLVYELPPDMIKSGDLEEEPLPFLFGTRPDKAKARYRFEILEDTEKVIHLRIHPKLKEDQQNFAVAEVWLNPKTFMPSKLKFLEPNKNEVTFTFKRIWSNVDRDNHLEPKDIDPRDFEGKVIRDWEIVRHKLGQKEGDRPLLVPRKD